MLRLIRTLIERSRCDGMISGSESILVWSRHPVAVTEARDAGEVSELPCIVFYGHGRIQWTDTQGLIVVTRQTVSAEYRTQLRDKSIPTVWAGTGEYIDIPDALDQLGAGGSHRLALNGGGRINGTFARAGLVDELILVWAPILIGGTTTPTLVDAADLTYPTEISPLELLTAESTADGLLWPHYRVQRDTTNRRSPSRSAPTGRAGG